MYREVLAFWFSEEHKPKWFVKDEAFDADIGTRFSAVHTRAAQCELWEWRSDPRGSLAEVIVLDQFSRNIHRDRPAAFATDALALALAQAAVAKGFDAELPPEKRSFLYMPFMHSESPAIHEEAVRLFTDLGLKPSLEFELKHKAIIDRFGRYPHRNEILGRPSTPEEESFLQEPDSSF